MEMLKKWNDLQQHTKMEIKSVFVMWNYDATSKDFNEWAQKHAFYVNKDGRLDARYNHCEPEYLA